MCVGADTLKVLTVYSDRIPIRGHQCNGQKWELGERGRREEYQEMKPYERDKKKGQLSQKQ